MQIRCPHCHVPFDSTEQDSWAEMVCPGCGSGFSLSGSDATYTYRPGVQILGHFELLQQVGAGRYGSVWKARDTQLQRTVAVKIPRQKDLDPRETDMFLRDARAAAQLKHPRIAGVHEVGRENDTVYIVTDFIDGANLSEWLTGQRLTSREAAELMVKIAEALNHAHEAGVVHRDLKPSNIMLDLDGQPHVIDFGLARRESGEIAMTVEGQVLGTPAYMSPEQARGEGHRADRRSDVYALGVILFELLTGELPFRGDARMLIVQILNEEPPSPRRLKASVSRDLETITLKCLQKDPAKRYQTAQALADDLKRHLQGEPIEARPIGRAQRAWRWCRRNPVIATLSGALLAVLVGISVGAPIVAVRQASLRHQAEQSAEMAKDSLAKAELQKKRAEGVNAFFTEAVFGQADPHRGGHAGIGLLEALDAAEPKIDERFPDDPEQRAVVRDRFGDVYLALDLPKKAVAQLEKAIAAREPLVGNLDPAVMKTRNQLGHALYAVRDFGASKGMLRATLDDQTRILGEGHPDTIRTALNFGLMLMEVHDPEDVAFAEKTYNTALQYFGPNDPLTLEAEYNYSWVLRWRLQLDKALQFAEPAAHGLQELKGEADPKSMFAAYNYASCLTELGRYKEAAGVFGPLLQVRNRVLGPTHVDSLFAAWRYADTLQKIGDDAAALKVLEPVREKLKEIEAEGIIRRADPLENMENLYVQLKHADRAAEIQDVMYRMFSKSLGEGDSHNVDFALLRTFVMELALSPVPELHNPKHAVELAVKACELTDNKNSDAIFAAVFAHVSNEDYKSATKVLDHLRDNSRINSKLEYELSLIRLLGGDIAGYRAACEAMARQFAASNSDDDLLWFTWACCLGPTAAKNLDVPLQAAKELAAKAPENETFANTLGILLYRTGNYDEASKRLAEEIAAVKKVQTEEFSMLYPQFFLAMSRWKQGDKEEAKRLLTEAQSAMEKDLQGSPLWNRKATLELFNAEAEGLIGKPEGAAK